MKMKSNKGFTLLEMLIVVAIIAILIAIAIPTFTKVLEKSREASDLANIRGQYSQVMMAVLEDDSTGYARDSHVVQLVQKKDGWDPIVTAQETLLRLGNPIGAPSKGGTCNVWYDPDTQLVQFEFEGGNGSSGDNPVLNSKVVFPEAGDPDYESKFGKAYAELMDRYNKDGVFDNIQKKSQLITDFGDHSIFQVENRNLQNGVLAYAKAGEDEYDSTVLSALSDTQGTHYAAFFDENNKLLGYTYQSQEGVGSKVKTYKTLVDASGNVLKKDLYNTFSYVECNQILANQNWPQS